MSSDRETYNPVEIEKKWRDRWSAEGFSRFAQPDRLGLEPPENKYYVLDMFPYPSGKLHMGHARNYSIGDVIARYRHRRGETVLHPMGWDAFGLPAENAAIQRDIHPDEWTQTNVGTFKEALRRLGIPYNWNREVDTSKPDYYRWTQWIFLKLYEMGLVYQKDSLANWCDGCQTVLANEQVVGGECERCGGKVTHRRLPQWFFKITDYAGELLDDLDELPEWPEQVRTMQRNWIGRSEGVEFDMKVEGLEESFSVFTTRVDTVYGMTYVVLAPEHPLVESLISGTAQESQTKEFVEETLAQDRFLRMADETEKVGVFTGRYAVNPVNGRRVPIWVANYVLMEYGTGIVMAVPASDTRDFAFARKYGLEIIPVVVPSGTAPDPATMTDAYTEPGVMVNSGPFDGRPSTEALEGIAAMMEREGYGRRVVNYRLRDWCISRQRYWGCPIPLVHCPDCGVAPVPYGELPVILPHVVNFRPKGISPLEEAAEWVETACPRCGGPARREVDTMDTFVDSSWYFFRYCAPSAELPFDKQNADAWMPVDTYIGGINHAVLHLMYARFITKALRDAGLHSVDEPFKRLFTQGMVTLGDKAMSKSRGNVVGIDVVCDRFGADTGRLFTLFASPPDREMEWTEDGVEGIYRFLSRLWRLFDGRWELDSTDYDPDSLDDELKALHRKRHSVVKKFTEDIERIHFNTAIAQAMELVNDIYGYEAKFPWKKCYSFEIHKAKFFKRIAKLLYQKKVLAEKIQAACYNFDSTFASYAPVRQQHLSSWQQLEKALRKATHAETITSYDITTNDSLSALKKALHSTIPSIAAAIERVELSINMTPLVDHPVVAACLRDLVDVLAPFAPFICEELNERLGESTSVHDRPWPEWDDDALEADFLVYPIQVNGKIRDQLRIAASATEDEIRDAALGMDNVSRYTDGRQIKFFKVVPGKLVTIAVK